MKKYVKATTYYKTDPRDLISEEDMYSEIVGYMLDLISGDYGEITLEEAANETIAWVTGLTERAKEEIASGEAKSIYDR